MSSNKRTNKRMKKPKIIDIKILAAVDKHS